MAFSNNSYATVWEIKPTRGASMSVRISTSRKDKKTDQYETDFSDYVFFSGEAARKAANLKEKDRVRLLQTSVSSQWDKDKKVNRYTFSVWDFEPAEQSSGKGRPSPVVPTAAAEPTAVNENDDLPF